MTLQPLVVPLVVLSGHESARNAEGLGFEQIMALRRPIRSQLMELPVKGAHVFFKPPLFLKFKPEPFHGLPIQGD
jgi:hypothetical protein